MSVDLDPNPMRLKFCQVSITHMYLTCTIHPHVFIMTGTGVRIVSIHTLSVYTRIWLAFIVFWNIYKCCFQYLWMFCIYLYCKFQRYYIKGMALIKMINPVVTSDSESHFVTKWKQRYWKFMHEKTPQLMEETQTPGVQFNLTLRDFNVILHKICTTCAVI